MSSQNHDAIPLPSGIQPVQSTTPLIAALPYLTANLKPQYTASHTHEAFNAPDTLFQQQPEYFQPDMVSSLQSPSQTTTQNLYQNNGNVYCDWDFNASASEYIAHNLVTDTIKTATDCSKDCSKCMHYIAALEERIASLEENVQALLASNNQHIPMASASFTKQATQALQSSIIKSPIKSVSSVASASNNQHVTMASSALTQPATTTQALHSIKHTPIKSFVSSVASAGHSTTANLDNANKHDEDVIKIDLLPGYGVKITVPQLDLCLHKAKGSGTALARLLVNVFFDDKTLAECSVRGTKSKPALDKTIMNAIIRYVWEKRNCSEKDVVQAINL